MSPVPAVDEAFEPLFAAEDEPTIRARWDAWANEGLTVEDGDDWTDTRPGSFFNIATTGGVRTSARTLDLMSTDYAAATFPKWSWGTHLDDIGEGISVPRLAASFASGTVTVTGPEGTIIPPGPRVGVESSALGGGQEFEVSDGGTIDGTLSLDLDVAAVAAGVDGNVAAGAITRILTVGFEAVTVTNADPIRGGADAQSDEALLERILGRFEGGAIPGTARWYEQLARDFDASIGRVTVIPLWDGPGTVLIVILDPDGGPLPSATVDAFQEAVDPYPALGQGEGTISATVTVATGTAIDVDVAAEVEFEQGYSLDGDSGTVALREALEAAIAEEVHRGQPGGEIIRRRIIGRLILTPGVHDVGLVTLNGVAGNVALSSDPAEVGQVDTITLTAI